MFEPLGTVRTMDTTVATLGAKATGRWSCCWATSEASDRSWCNRLAGYRRAFAGAAVVVVALLGDAIAAVADTADSALDGKSAGPHVSGRGDPYPIR